MESFLADNILAVLGSNFLYFGFSSLDLKLTHKKKKKTLEKNLENGQKIITIGGIHGKIVGIKESTVLLEIEGGNKIKVNKTAILSYKE